MPWRAMPPGATKVFLIGNPPKATRSSVCFSTIVHEVDFIGINYPDAEMATTRAEQNYLGAFGYKNEAILNDPTTSRGTYEPPWPAGTRTASVNFGYGPRERSRDAREGHPMVGWKTRGVKSRLAVAVRGDQNREINTNLPSSIALAGGTVAEHGYTRDRLVRLVVIHATHDKRPRSRWLPPHRDGTLISKRAALRSGSTRWGTG
jgi:hypothetical protein